MRAEERGVAFTVLWGVLFCYFFKKNKHSIEVWLTYKKLHLFNVCDVMGLELSTPMKLPPQSILNTPSTKISSQTIY